MAVNRSRSQNRELIEGSSDGTFKKIPRDRSVVNDPNLAGRAQMPWRYGFEDPTILRRPDTGAAVSPYYSDHG